MKVYLLDIKTNENIHKTMIKVQKKENHLGDSKYNKQVKTKNIT